MIETGTFLQQRYRIDKQIGQGGMGAVYVATDERFGSTVAIKETLCQGENFRKAIEREARLLNSLKHSALPRVSDHFKEAESQFIVMEYIPGDDVATMLENSHNPFPVEQVLRWADQLLDALDYLHTQDMPVIHRDIKPQNLKINSRGEMILLDFGLAKGNPTEAEHQTAAKSIFGYSRNYASLEQIQGTGTDPRSDLYSLAATLYHLLTGRAPEDALTRAMTVLSQKPDPLVPASTVNPAVPRGVAGVLQIALDLNASGRPESAAAMREMLRDSDQYASYADPVRGASHLGETALFAQPTQLMPEATLAAAPLMTDVRTKIASEPDHQMTAVAGFSGELTRQDSMSDSVGGQNRGGVIAAVAGAVLLLVAGVAGGLYIMAPASSGAEVNGQNAQQVVTSPQASNSAAIAAESAPAGSTSVPEPGVSSAAKSNIAEKNAETAKKNTAPKTNKDTGTGGETLDITADDPEVPPGGVVFTQRDENGKVRTIRVNPPNLPPDKRNGMGGSPFPPGVDPRMLTPEQVKQIQEAWRLKQMTRRHREPSPPPPTPENPQ